MQKDERNELSRRVFMASGLSAVSASSLSTATDAVAAPKANVPRMAQSLAEDFTVVHRRRNPKTYVEGCGLIVLPGGSILAVVPVVPRGGVPKRGPTEINFVRSEV